MQKSGFKMWVLALAMVLPMNFALNEGCSVVCKGGTIKSPNYPHDYNNKLHLNWTLTAPEGQHVLINITDVETECGYDYLTIYDGHDAHAPQLGQYCTLEKDRLFASTGETLFITFVSDNSVVHRGFSLTYTCIGCDRHLFNSFGDIESPLYPQNYVNNAQCSWLIEAHEGELIFLYISEVDTECGYDKLSVHDGKDAHAPLLFSECSSQQLSIASTSKYMYINFTTDASVTSKGFSAFYNFYSGCGAKLKDPVGAFTSPGYPYGYSDNLKCSWTIEADEDSAITLNFDTLNVECYYDNVRVYDGEDIHAPLIADLCNAENYTLTSTGSTLFITFESDYVITLDGFSASYYFGCGNHN